MSRLRREYWLAMERAENSNCASNAAMLGSDSCDEYRLQCRIGEFFSPNCSSLERESLEFDAYIALAVLKTGNDWDTCVEEYDNDE